MMNEKRRGRILRFRVLHLNEEGKHTHGCAGERTEERERVTVLIALNF